MSHEKDDAPDPIDALLGAHAPEPGPAVAPSRLRQLDEATEAALVHDPEGRARLVQQAQGVPAALLAFAEAHGVARPRRRWAPAVVAGGLALAAALAVLLLRPTGLQTRYEVGAVAGVEVMRGDTPSAATLTPGARLSVVLRPEHDTAEVPAVGVWGPTGRVDVQVERGDTGALRVSIPGAALTGQPAGSVTLTVVLAAEASALAPERSDRVQVFTVPVTWLPAGR